MRALSVLAVFAFASSLALPAGAQLIRPTSATAGSEFSSLYDIGNAIDGSGLPPSFDLSSLHSNYVINNHWTTAGGAISAGTAFATFFFDQPQSLGQFHLWNHRSNNIANNAFYAVTQFDLVFRDASSNTIFELNDVPAVGGLGIGAVQTFAFNEVTGVSSVVFRIDRDSSPSGTSGPFTGVAEVAFGAPIPEPSTWLLMALGAGVLLAKRRQFSSKQR
jgi:hypothetical protein